MRKKLDPYEWSKARILNLYSSLKDWDDTEIATSKHDVWSIKKLIALDYYVGPFVRIMRGKGFKKWCYVDPFSGSGLLRLLGKYPFPGSPLIPLFRAQEVPFSKYYLSDIDTRYVEALDMRVNRIRNKVNVDVEVRKLSFSDRVMQMFSGTKPSYWKDAGYLVFLDPFGLQVDWQSMARILKSGAIDIIFTFMTWAIVWNRNNELAEDKLTAYFGDDTWKNLQTQDDFVNHYCKKIQQFGYLYKYKTFTIDVIQKGGKRYDLILATQSRGGTRVLNDLIAKVKAVTTELLGDAFSVAVGEQIDLDSFTETEDSENE